MPKLLTLLAVLCATSSLAQPAPQFVNASPDSIALARRLYTALLATCPDIKKYGAAIRKIEASENYMPQLSPDGEKQKWRVALLVQVFMSDRTEGLPWSLQLLGKSGHAVFLVGGPDNPGVALQSGEARTLCGQPLQWRGEGNQFLSIPSLARAPGWPRPETPGERRTRDNLDGTAQPLEPR